MDREVYKADWLLLLTALIWGTAFVAQRMGMDHIGPFLYNGIRFFLGALVLIPLCRRPDPKPRLQGGLPGFMAKRPMFWAGLMTGLILYVAANFQQIGLVYTTAGKAGFITGLYVVIVPIFGVFMGFPMRWGGWAGAGLSAVGLYLLSITETYEFAPGDLWVLVGAICWSIHMLLLAWLSPRVNTVKLAQSQFLVCAVLSLITALIMEPISPPAIWRAAIPILYGGVLSVGVAYTLQVVAQKAAPPVHAAVILCLESVFAALAGWLILDETMALRGFIGCGLMLAGMLLAQLRS